MTTYKIIPIAPKKSHCYHLRNKQAVFKYKKINKKMLSSIPSQVPIKCRDSVPTDSNRKQNLCLIIKFILLCMYCVYERSGDCPGGGPRTACRSQFPSSTLCIHGLNVGGQAWQASAFTYWAILQVPEYPCTLFIFVSSINTNSKYHPYLYSQAREQSLPCWSLIYLLY